MVTFLDRSYSEIGFNLIYDWHFFGNKLLKLV